MNTTYQSLAPKPESIEIPHPAQAMPQMSNAGLESIHQVSSHDQYGDEKIINIVGELPLTIKVDGQELVTLMTLGTHPEKLVLGYLRNQTLFNNPSEIESINVDWDREIAEVINIRRKRCAGI